MPLRPVAARAALFALVTLLASCSSLVPEPRETVSGHVSTPPPQAVPSSAIPRPVTRAPTPLPPVPAPAVESYTVVVNGVPVRELLFALARDASLNVDIHPRISGSVTLNAIDQTLPQILERLTRQVDLRYRLEDDLLTIEPDEPFLRTYTLDYVALSRTTSNSVEVGTQISGIAGGGDGSSDGGGNNSTTTVGTQSSHDVWTTIVSVVGAMLEERQQEATAAPQRTVPSGVQGVLEGALGSAGENNAPATAVAEAPSQEDERTKVIANREAGLLTIRATERQHGEIQRYIDSVNASITRQVLIEVTLAEVQLSDNFASGINWSLLAANAGLSIAQGTFSPVNLVGLGTDPANTSTLPAFLLQYADQRTNGVPSGDLSATASLLKDFGDVRIISSPKIMSLNNQTAVLKVVNNEVFFTSEVTPGAIVEGRQTDPVVEVNIETVPVGFVMSVTPQIGAADTVTLNIRPTISAVARNVPNPDPNLVGAAGISTVPVLQVREFASILRAQSGQIAILGGLMRDETSKQKSGLPFLTDLEEIGDFFSTRNNQFFKSELVVFIRPWVIRKPSVIDGDLRSFERYLPENQGPRAPLLPSAQANRP